MSRTGQMSSSPPSTALDRFRPRERDRLALGATAGERRQPAQDEISIGDRLPADLVKRVGHRAGPMRRQQQASTLRAGSSLGAGSCGKTSVAARNRPLSTCRRNSGKSTTPARLINRNTEPGAIISNSRLPRKPWLALVTAANTMIAWLVFNTSSRDAEATPKPAM